MRKVTILLLVITSLSLLDINSLYAQIWTWSPRTRITNGNYRDINPDFGSLQTISFITYNSVEFLVFQREADTSSNVCVIKFNKDGITGPLQYLTNNNFKNRNPCVGYSFGPGFQDSVRNALALWETNQNGNWDIYGSYFSSTSGWSLPFAVDSGAGAKLNPKAVMINSSEFGITYSRNDDIIFRRYNAITKTVITETNITSSIIQTCKAPHIGYTGSSLGLSFQLLKVDNSSSLYKVVSSNAGATWVNMDTISTIGNNKMDQVTFNSFLGSNYIYESNKSGKYGIYESSTSGTGQILVSPNFNYYNFKTYYYPIITSNTNLLSNISAVVRKSNDSTKIMFDPVSSGGSKDSLTAGDTTKKVILALTQGMRNSDGVVMFMVFNLDSAGNTSLYFKKRIVPVNDIHFTGNTINKDFQLYQNYPNPFNPVTKIKFDIPKSLDVKLIIFDAVGREVKNITQNNMIAGSYEYEFNGENLSSGIYYFKLQTNEFSKTMKMVLVK